MSTWEHDEFEYACPCGAGHVLKTVDSADNPWSKPDLAYSLHCDICSENWHFNHYNGLMTNKASSKPREGAVEKLRQLELGLHEITNSVINQHLASLNLPTKKAEWEYARAENIFDGTYQTYLKHRHSNMRSALKLRPQSPFVAKLLKGSSTKTVFDDAIEKIADAQKAVQSAEALIVEKQY